MVWCFRPPLAPCCAAWGEWMEGRVGHRPPQGSVPSRLPRFSGWPSCISPVHTCSLHSLCVHPSYHYSRQVASQVSWTSGTDLTGQAAGGEPCRGHSLPHPIGYDWTSPGDSRGTLNFLSCCCSGGRQLVPWLDMGVRTRLDLTSRVFWGSARVQ